MLFMWHQRVADGGRVGGGGGMGAKAVLLVGGAPWVRQEGGSTGGATAATNMNRCGRYDQTTFLMYSYLGQDGAPCDFSYVLDIVLGLFCIQQVT